VSVSLSIVIVSYNVRYFLEQCLHTVRRAGMGMQVEVIVVDNGSGDGSVPYLKPLFREVQFIEAGRNLGFAKACNLGYKHTSGNYVLFLNPDVLLAEDTLRVAVQFLINHPEAGAVGVKMIDGSGSFLKESKRGFPAPLAALYKLCGLARLFPRSSHFSRYYLGHLDAQQNHSVDVLAGAFMMLPRTVLEQAGLFDETFFMYGEDIDLSYRIKQKGYQNYYLADTAIVHFKGESTRRPSLKHIRLFYKAMSIFVRKHYKSRVAGLFVLLLQAGILLHALFALLIAFASRIKTLFYPGSKPLSHGTVYIVADWEQYKHIAAVLQQQGCSAVHLKSLPHAAVHQKGQQVVLCSSGGSMACYIAWLQQQPRMFQCFFHVPDSGGMVGSSLAGRNGHVLAMPGAPLYAPAISGVVN
jgi:N-acetylglucosaminyl-diphospho-decaprenol L-rhamnosyltransferase